jgi:hypothetical protein
MEEKANGIDLDYGVEFRNFDNPGDWNRPAPDKRVQLFKPHGSLDWLFCPTCNDLEITPAEKGVVTRLLVSNFALASCPHCQSVYAPLIVPPTFYKDLSNVFLSAIWNRTDVALRKVNHIIFCGSSFPEVEGLREERQRSQQTLSNYTRLLTEPMIRDLSDGGA